MQESFTKKDATIIKGVAIVCMLMFHLWAFPDRIAGGELKFFSTVFEIGAPEYFGSFGNICVSLYFFLSGYGLYQSSLTVHFDILGKVKRLYLTYWKVFVLFVPLAFLFCTNQPDYCEYAEICHRYGEFHWEEYFRNFFGFNSSYNGEWWFLIHYVYALITFPILVRLIRRHSALVNLCGVTIAGILINNVTPAIGQIEALGWLSNNYFYRTFLCPPAPYIIGFWMGAIVAKDDLLGKLRDELSKNRMLNPLADLAGLAILIFLRNVAIDRTADYLFIPFLILFSLDLIRRFRPLAFLFRQLGKQSTNMWLIHSFFCYYFYPVVRIVVWPGYALPSLLILIVLSYLASVAVTWFWKGLGWLCSKSFMRIRQKKQSIL